MMILKRIGIVIVLLAIFSGAGLFLFRGTLLRHVVKGKIETYSDRYGLRIAYASLKMPSLATVRVEGVSVVPLHRDTLLKLRSAEVELELLPLLQGNLSVKSMHTDGLTCRFVKCGGKSNYDLFFQRIPQEPRGQETEDVVPIGYARRVEQALGALFRLLPEDATLRHTTFMGERDSLQTVFMIPDLVLEDRKFVSEIAVSEEKMNGKWRVAGTLDCKTRLIEGSIASAESGKRIVVPYILPHYQTFVAFDSVAFSMKQEPFSAGNQTLTGYTEIGGLEIHHKALSSDTIGLDKGEVEYMVHVGERAFELDSATTVRFNRLSFHPFVRADKTDRWHFTASVHRPSFPAQDLFASLPSALFSHLRGLEVEGELSYDLNADVDFNCLDSLKFSSNLRGHGFRIHRMGTTDLSRMSTEFEYTAYEHDTPVRTFAIGPSNPHFRPLSCISPLLQMAVMQSEDGSFYYHDGFYPGAIQEALAYDLQKGGFARGGSSITMQLVKNVFLNRHKNIARKLEEALIVWLIESQHLTSKERMYEVYLNIIEWGPLVYGAAEASRFYFEKEPSELTVSEAIFLASIIPRPKHFRSVFNPDATLRENQLGYYRVIARRLAVKGLMTEEEAEAFVPDVQIRGEARRLVLQPDTLISPVHATVWEAE